MMRKLRTPLSCGLLAAAALATAGAAPAAQAQPERSLRGADCFRTHNWNGWSSPSPDVLYLRVGVRDVYRVDLQGGGGRIDRPGDFLVNVQRGPSLVCAPIDLDLKVSDQNGFQRPLFPVAITKLTPEEVAALPRKHRP